MQVYRARNPRKSPLWQCARRHYEEFEQAYPDKYQPRYGILRPIIPEVVHKFLNCGNLERGFARIRAQRQVQGGAPKAISYQFISDR
jgi:hypothetical protein